MDKKVSTKTIFSNLIVYGIGHSIVDLVCAAVVFSIAKDKIVSPTDFLNLILLYNLAAFGLQFIFGLIVDRLKSPRAATMLGFLLTGISAVTFSFIPLFAIISAGIGNALFHIGGGTVSLNLTPKKASAPGIFVAPGAIGLLVGTMMGKGGSFVAWPFILLLLILAILIFIIKCPKINYEKSSQQKDKINYFTLIFALVFLSIAIRSLVGFVVVLPWKSDINLLITLTVFVVLGKGLGGILADKFGWIKVAVGALMLSIPLLTFGASYSYLGILGMFLFNITMPVTLVALSNILPGRPAFAFGLTCLALIIGSFPAFTGTKLFFSNPILLSVIIFTSTAALFGGLQLLINNRVFSYNKKVN